MRYATTPSSNEVVQSYLITSARYNFSVYEKRILYRIVELIQQEINNVPLSPGVKIEPTLFKDREITMPLSSFLLNEEGDKTHKRIRKAFRGLISRVVEKETPEAIDIFPLVARAKIHRYQRHVTFILHKELYEDLLDFGKGFSKYELETAFSFRSQYTMRLYELISKQDRPMNYSVDSLKEMFCLEDKYSVITLFIKRVIAPAQKELEASDAPCFFTYEPVKTGRSITHIRFINHKRRVRKTLALPLPKTADEQKKLNHLLNYLSAQLKVDPSVFKHHHQLLLDNLNIPTDNRPKNELDIIIKGAEKVKANNPVGYVVSALKKRIQSAAG